MVSGFLPGMMCKPVSVYARAFSSFPCCNGAVAFVAKPLLEHIIEFHRYYGNERYSRVARAVLQGNVTSRASKIAAVPSNNLEYTDEASKRINSGKCYVLNRAESENKSNTPPEIEWETAPMAFINHLQQQQQHSPRMPMTTSGIKGAVP